MLSDWRSFVNNRTVIAILVLESKMQWLAGLERSLSKYRLRRGSEVAEDECRIRLYALGHHWKKDEDSEEK